MRTNVQQKRKLEWVAGSLKEINALPAGIKSVFGFALYQAQLGGQHESAKVLKGFAGAGVVEVVESDEAGTYRAVYTVKFKNAVYVLYCFQKKASKAAKHQNQIWTLFAADSWRQNYFL